MVATNVKNDPNTDWRGTVIAPGDTVIYGAGVGRSVQLVEGEVVENNAGKVKIKILRRSYTSSNTQFVTMGHDRITVVNELPPCNLPFAAEQIAERKARDAQYKSHKLKDEQRDQLVTRTQYLGGGKTHSYQVMEPTWVRFCKVCGLEGYTELYDNQCTGKTA